MNRLESELQRLYRLPATAAGIGPLADPRGQTRALVLELARPADWDALSQVWRGVQADLGLPAPGIAVSGADGMQLWFSLQQPAGADVAAAFLQGLIQRYLAGVAPARVRSMPSATEPTWQAPPVPAQRAGTENWSAFVAPDLAPVFVDTPWLDIEPGVDGQADVLARLESIKPAAFDGAMRELAPAAAPTSEPVGRAAHETGDVDPRRFLQQVLNDETVALALRIEAAQALLRFSPRRDA